MNELKFILSILNEKKKDFHWICVQIKIYRNGSKMSDMYNAQALRANWNDSRVDFTVYELVGVMPWQPPRLARAFPFNVRCTTERDTILYKINVLLQFQHKNDTHAHMQTKGHAHQKFSHRKRRARERNVELMKQQKILLQPLLDRISHDINWYLHFAMYNTVHAFGITGKENASSRNSSGSSSYIFQLI